MSAPKVAIVIYTMYGHVAKRRFIYNTIIGVILTVIVFSPQSLKP
jgi:hypothetical protein